ncbi:myosin-2-like, partial [Trifolium medium]|nr:myosin-2-like [Trifolium medium]
MVGALEDKRKLVLQGILGVQKCVRGHQARSHFNKLKNGVTILQSFVRGEIARRKYGVMVKSSITISSENIEEIQAIITLQSVIRGWLVRKHNSSLNKLKKHPENGKSRRRSRLKMSFDKQKEEENAELREQLKQFEKRWIEYEKKMKTMEEMWQRQMASLQMSLAAAKTSLASENANGQPSRHDVSLPSNFCYDSEEAISMGSRTPRTPGCSTPLKYSSSLSEVRAARDGNGAINNLMKEFEQRRQTFDEDAR